MQTKTHTHPTVVTLHRLAFWLDPEKRIGVTKCGAIMQEDAEARALAKTTATPEYCILCETAHLLDPSEQQTNNERK